MTMRSYGSWLWDGGGRGREGGENGGSRLDQALLSDMRKLMKLTDKAAPELSRMHVR